MGALREDKHTARFPIVSLRLFTIHELSLAIGSSQLRSSNNCCDEVCELRASARTRRRRERPCGCRRSEGGRKPVLWRSSRASRPMVLGFGIIGQDNAGRSARSRRPAFRQQVPNSCKALVTISAIVRMVLTMVPNTSAIFAAHGATMRSSPALWRGVLIIGGSLLRARVFADEAVTRAPAKKSGRRDSSRKSSRSSSWAFARARTGTYKEQEQATTKQCARQPLLRAHTFQS